MSKIKIIQNNIYTIRETQVMLDSDLAELYKVETRVLNQAVKRNIERFPLRFMFQLTENEFEYLRSQFVTLKKKRGEHRKYLPYVFTEQGVSMLAGILKSKTAVQISIKIIDGFVAMRKFVSQNEEVFARIKRLEDYKDVSSKKLEKVLKALEGKSLKPKQGIFFNGQIFDAYLFVSKLIKTAKQSIILIDNYINEDTLHLLSKRNKNTSCVVYTSKITKKLHLDLKKFNSQNRPIQISKFNKSHDRFIIIDEKSIYHFGASLKDLGKKWFAFSKMDINIINVLEKLKVK